MAKTVKAFFAKYPVKRFKKGQIIAYGGEDLPGVFYLVSGTVRQYDITAHGDEVVVNVFKPPAFFPMSWAINRRKNLYFFETLEETVLHQAPAEEAVAFLQNNPNVMFDLLKRLYSGVDGLQRRMAHLMGGSASSRLLFELITECKRFGKRQPDGGYVLAVSEGELASRMGVARETVNRELGKIKNQGLIEYEHGIHIPDLRKLEAVLGDGL